MLRHFTLIIVCLLVATLARATVVDFEDKTLAPNSFYNGSDLAGGFTSSGVRFNNNYDDTFGVFWGGFSYSNVNDTVDTGSGNQYAAITDSGVGGSGNYGVSYYDQYGFGVLPTITLPYVAKIQSIDVTNTTWAFLSMRDGNDGSGFVRQFGDDPNIPGHGNQGYPDWFKLIIAGKDGSGNVTGTVDFYLADYRFANNADDYVVDDWRSVDLTSLGDVKTLEFTMDSSDTGAFGINTPTYFALDNVTFVPEPGAMLVPAIYLMSFWVRRSGTR